MSSKIEVKNPYNLESFQSLELQSEAKVMVKLARAFERVSDRANILSPQKRVDVLKKAKNILESKRDQLIRDAVLEGGKPYQDTSVEIDRGLTGIETAIHELFNFGGREIMMNLTDRSAGRRAFTFRQPRGVVVAISAFNHPFNLAVHQVVPAIASGCPVLIKPATNTPLSAGHLVNALLEAGLPEDYCHYVPCKNEIAEKLATDPRVSFLSFIGSSKVGWHLRSKLPQGATCALEHGGAAPVIIDETAQLKDAVQRLSKAGYYHAGQVCVSAQRIYVQEKAKAAFVELFSDEVRKLKVGDPLDPSTDVGPLIEPKEVDRVHSWVTAAQSTGAKLVCGGKRISETCYEPTILLNPGDEDKVSKQEIFGPVTCVYTYKTLEEAIQRSNAVSFAFQASIFSSNINRAMQAVEELEGQTVMINEHPAFRVDWMPFGGYKESGLGLGGIGESMKDMSIEKLMVIRKLEEQ